MAMTEMNYMSGGGGNITETEQTLTYNQTATHSGTNIVYAVEYTAVHTVYAFGYVDNGTLNELVNQDTSSYIVGYNNGELSIRLNANITAKVYFIDLG